MMLPGLMKAETERTRKKACGTGNRIPESHVRGSERLEKEKEDKERGKRRTKGEGKGGMGEC